MAASGGYWLNLAEAQKLTQTTLVPGVIEENIRRGGILASLPLVQVIGKSLTWNKEDTEREGREVAPGDQLTWTDNIKYTQKEVELKIVYDQTPLDHFVESTYGNINNYEAITLRGLRKGLLRRLEDRFVYADLTYGINEFDGLHAIGEEGAAALGVDENGALSIANMRSVQDEMKLGIDFWLMPFEIARRIDAFYQEAGSVTSGRSIVGSYWWDKNEMGMRIPVWNGVPIVRSDYLVAEDDGTGVGSNRRAKYTSGTKTYSIFAVKMGQIRELEGGISLAFGGERHDLGEFFKTVYFPNLENYDAAGLRLVAYASLAAGSKYAVGRIFDITDAAVTE